MVIFWCPDCGNRIVVMPHTGDVVHACNSGNSTLDQEDVLHFHTEFTDSEGVVHKGKGPQEAMWSSVANELQGSLGWIAEGEDNETRGDRGRKLSLYRQRQKFKHIEIPNRNY